MTRIEKLSDPFSVESLAAKLKRPPRLWTGIGRLAPGEIEFLSDAIDEARRRRREHVETKLREAFFLPLGGLLLKLLRRADP